MPGRAVTPMPSFPRPRLARLIAVAGSLLASPAAFAVEALPTVVVTGADPAEEVRQELAAEQALTPGGVTLVDGEDVSRRQTSTLADLLRYVPGVWAASSSGSDGTFLSIRGSNLDAVDHDGNGVRLLQDGLPVTAADGNNHNRFLDPLAVRHAVVARGANALTYGASTLGGAIDFTSPTALDSAPVELFLNTGSHGQWQGRLGAGGIAGNVDGHVTVEAKQRDGYRDHNEQQGEAVYANAGWQVSDTVQSRLYLSHLSNDEELPGALTRAQWQADPDQASAAAVAGNYQRNVDAWRVANKTTWTLADDSSFSLGISVEAQALYHPIVQSPFFSLLIDTDQRTVGAALRYRRHAGEHDLLAGLNAARTGVDGGNYGNRGGHAAGLRTRVDNEADSTELFVMDRWQFAPRWTLVYGTQAVLARREVRNTDIATGTLRHPQADYDSVNPRAGLIFRPTPQAELFANLSRLYEAPTLYQLEDEVSGSNRTLDAMRGTVLEIGTRSTQETGENRWRWDVALYYAKLRDEILSIDDPAAPGTSLSTNVDDTLHAGLEALVGASFALGGGHRLEPLLSLTLNHFVFDGDPVYGDNELPAAPGHALRGELLYRHASGFFAGPTVDVVGERYADFSNTYTVDDYALLGLRAGLARQQWEVFGEIRNLADTDYIARHNVRDVAGPNDAILSPGEPLSAYAGVKLQF